MIKLLHVEDDADIREIAKMSLELTGDFEVVQCNSGQEALDTVPSFTPDVILLDIMMPGMTGKETLEHLRKIDALKETPAIFMTARAQNADVEEFRAVGAVEVICKPFDPMSLAEQIKTAMNA